MKNRGAAGRGFGLFMILVVGAFLLGTRGWGATVLSGNVSGTWTTNGSPYILSANCTVVSNETLTILPGVEVIMGLNVRLTVFGGISAIGTPERWIAIRGTSPTQYWLNIQIWYSGFTNRFRYCRISDARQSALRLDVRGGDSVMAAEISHSDFFNCRESAITAWAEGPSGSATLVVEIHNCTFDSTEYGCVFAAYSHLDAATANPTISGNVFKNLRYAALYAFGGGTNLSKPVFINNTVVNANQGIAATDDTVDVLIRNNLFLSNTKAVSSGLSRDTSYNCFYGNGTNFVGYPSIYGVPIQNNHNGDPCDAFFNIFLDPQVLDTNRFLLSNSSPCIDAGDPAIADVCFQFSHGSAISDLGAYGGPEACGWLAHGFAPVITRASADQSSCVGGSASFNVRAEGSEPLRYQWFFNGTNLLNGETNAQVNLANLQTNQAGFYSVTVSNAFGSVSSPPARLLVFDACVGIHLYAGLNITGMVGRTYTVESATNLAAMNWTFVASNTFTQTKWLFIDTNTPFDAKKFFRVRLEP